MAEYRPSNMMARNGYSYQNPGTDYRNGMNHQRMMHTRPEPVCSEPKKETCDQKEKYEVGMAYVPWQKWKDTYELDKALQCGTIFPELDKRFQCTGGGCR